MIKSILFSVMTKIILDSGCAKVKLIVIFFFLWNFVGCKFFREMYGFILHWNFLGFLLFWWLLLQYAELLQSCSFFFFLLKFLINLLVWAKKKKNCYKDLGMICLTGLVYLIVSMIFPYLKWPFGCDCNLALLYTMMSWPFLKEQYRSWNGVLQILVLVFQSVLHVTLLEFIETWCCWNYEKGLFFLSDAST